MFCDDCPRKCLHRVRCLSNVVQIFLAGRLAGKNEMSLQQIVSINSFDSRCASALVKSDRAVLAKNVHLKLV